MTERLTNDDIEINEKIDEEITQIDDRINFWVEMRTDTSEMITSLIRERTRFMKMRQ